MSDQEPAIVVKDLYKSFKLPHEQHSGIKQRIINGFKGKKGYEVQKVLEDVSFEIKKGEFFGIVGRNGSGKSTLLKLIAGIYTPDKGIVHINGSLTPFIELGVGFNPELTGRENVFLNGALLGFSNQEMEAMYDEIVNFSELEDFMDQKLKNYSSGMQVRLAFSIAIRANTDILVLDEVLAVGDASFQQKCYDYFNSLKENKKTVILVTHDMSAVSRFCDRALYIDEGKVTLIGSTRSVSDRYLEDNYNKISRADDKDSTEIPRSTIKKVALSKTALDSGDKLQATIHFDNPNGLPIHFGFQIFGQDGSYGFGTNTKINGLKSTTSLNGEAIIDVKIDLVPGVYFIAAAVMNSQATSVIDYQTKVGKIIINRTTEVGGIAYLPHNWKISKESER